MAEGGAQDREITGSKQTLRKPKKNLALSLSDRPWPWPEQKDGPTHRLPGPQDRNPRLSLARTRISKMIHPSGTLPASTHWVFIFVPLFPPPSSQRQHQHTQTKTRSKITPQPPCSCLAFACPLFHRARALGKSYRDDDEAAALFLGSPLIKLKK